MPPADMAPYDCQACGACCCNSTPNRAERFVDYVEIKRRDPLWQRPDLIASLTVVNRKGERHLKLWGRQQRCIALEGKVGEGVRCTIYEVRPRPCRILEAGSKECEERRREKRLPVTPA